MGPWLCTRRTATWLRAAAWTGLMWVTPGCHPERDQWLLDLNSPRAELRSVAVHKLGVESRADDLPLFLQAAHDATPLVRAEAAEALGRTGDERVIDLLSDLLADPDEQVQGHAAEALGRMKSDKAQGYLVLQYGRHSRATRAAIVEALRGRGMAAPMAVAVAAEAQGEWNRTSRALTEGSEVEQASAAEQLGRSGRPEAVDRLLPMIRDRRLLVASAAVRGLGLAGDLRAAAPISALLSEPYPELRRAVCEALLQLGDSTSVDRLLAVALERSPTSSFATAALIGLSRSPALDRALCEVTARGAPPEVQRAGEAMRARGGCDLAPFLALPKPGDTPVASLQALIALGADSPEVLSRACALLSDKDAVVRGLAIRLLGDSADRSITPLVANAVAIEEARILALEGDWIPAPLPQVYAAGYDPAAPPDPSANPLAAERSRQAELFEKVRVANQAKAALLGKVPTVVVAPEELVEDVDDEELRPLASGLRALGQLRAPGARTTLLRYAHRSRPLLRAAALSGLAALGPEGFADATEGLRDSDPTVQEAVAEMLARSGTEGQRLLLSTLPTIAGDKSRVVEALLLVPLSPEMAPSLEAVLPSGGKEAAQAALLLGKLGVARSAPALLRALADGPELAGPELLVALGKLGVPSTAPAVAAQLFDQRPEVRAASAQVLARLATPSQREALEAARADYHRRVREAAGAALRRLDASRGENKK